MLRLLVSLLALMPDTLASIQRQCPEANVCFSLNIPDSTLESGSGDIYLQLTTPTSYSYIGFTQGTQMSNANYFILYTSADGSNVTVSPRLNSGGHNMPAYTQSTEFEVLEGSGVENGVMTANVKCSNCNSWTGGTMDLSSASTSTSWIYATLSGSALNTDSASASISKHDTQGTLTFNIASHGGSSSNPFLDPSTNTTTTTGGAASGGKSERAMIITAHAVLACLAWAFIFPFGGILIRLFSFPNLLWVHAALQILGLCVYIAAVGLGLSIAIGDTYLQDKHAIIGLVLFVVFAFQPLSGYVHHAMFKKYISRTLWSYVHIWIGRLGITLGMINAGFGLELMGKGVGNWEVKTYIVCVVIVWVVYVGSIAVGEMRRKNMDRQKDTFDGIRRGACHSDRAIRERKSDFQ
ncbi:CBD9-like protein [Massarina eburnea CBS 473.64]|uniref:CBD9-like protein n=1 Tax=Massarina eburnea CBS 473.64 TaxID=1395130 RepID=A0A6A6S1S4_9PLEO|nr:CBD9-like protein [Massarina eburnea CBS 473.64]